MRVVGISPLDKDATASFLEDGRVVFACGEERLSRIKLQGGFPHRAVRLGLGRTGWDPSSVDTVAYSFFDGDGEAQLIRQAVQMDAKVGRWNGTRESLTKLRRVVDGSYEVDRSVTIPGFQSRDVEFLPQKAWWKRLACDLTARNAYLDRCVHRHFLHRWAAAASADHRLRTRQLDAGLAEYGWRDRLKRFNHHDSHAANGFFSAPFDEALVITLDGYGSGNCGAVYRATRDGFERLHSYRFPNSFGQYYEHVTSALGFTAGRHEGKIVGLAAYGDPNILSPVLLDRIDFVDGDVVMRAAENFLFTRSLAQRFAKRDVAAAYQHVLEVLTQKLTAWWVARTGLKNIVVSGGVHANVKLNQRMRQVPGVESVFVYPNMGDGGCGTGAALLCFDPALFDNAPITNVYYGPDYSDGEIEVALIGWDLPPVKHDDIESRVAELLADNRIVARFNGRMEYGPRALGNRSILYPAGDPEVNQWLNNQLGRTEFMPFAPAVLAEEAHHMFFGLNGCHKTAEFMTITFDCKPEMVDSCPAAVHVDRTARPQLVSEQTNASFYRILKAYHAITGIPAVINTSFNMHEEPIVCCPTDAVRAFLQGGMDYLAIGDYLVPHPDRHELLAQPRRIAASHT